MWGFNGVEHIELEHGYQFHGEETTKGLTFKTSLRLALWSEPQVNAILFTLSYGVVFCLNSLPANNG